MADINMDVVGAKSQEKSRTWIANNGLPLFTTRTGTPNPSRVVLSMQSHRWARGEAPSRWRTESRTATLWAMVLYRSVFFSARIVPSFRIPLAIRGLVEVD